MLHIFTVDVWIGMALTLAFVAAIYTYNFKAHWHLNNTTSGKYVNTHKIQGLLSVQCTMCETQILFQLNAYPPIYKLYTMRHGLESKTTRR